MKLRVLVFAGLLCGGPLASLPMPVRASESPADLTAQVRATEIAFAKSLADRDVHAFTRMIAPDAIWIADATLHGPAEVLSRWRKYFDAERPPFSWSPELIEVQAGGKLALSTGPVIDAAGKRIGTYTSIWRREKKGEWRLIFDRGCPYCDCGASKPAG